MRVVAVETDEHSAMAARQIVNLFNYVRVNAGSFIIVMY